MKNRLINLIDFEKVNVLLEGFNKTTGFVTAILDLDGNVLSKSGWQPICTEFHRINPKTAEKCKKSDTVLADKMAFGEKYHFYRCLNGLVDVAIPIVIKDEHIANLFTGQFFFEKPDYSFFIKQAKKYGFNEKTYIDALDKVPVVSEENVKTAMDFLLNMTALIARITLQQVEQDELNKALKESEKQLIFHYKNSPLAIIEWDADLKIRRWSGTSEKIFGWKEDEMVGKSIYTLNQVNEDDFQEIQKIVEQLASGISNQMFSRNRNCTKTGRTIYCEWYSSVLLDQDGKMISVMSRVLDVTDRINTEISLSESEEKYRLLHEAAGVGIGYYNTEGIVISYNNIAAQNMNGKPEDFAGKSILDLFPKSIAQFFMKRIEKAVVSETPEEYEDKVQLPKAVKWFSSIYSRIIDTNHNIAGVQIISADITDRKLAEEQKAEIYKRFEKISANVPGAIYEFCLSPDGSTSIPFASGAISKIYGVSPEEVRTDATKIFELVHPDDRSSFLKSISESAEKLSKWHNEHRVILSSGKTIWVEGMSTPQKLEDGSIIWYGYINDITERKKSEIELIESKSFFEQLFIQSSTSTQLLDIEGWCVKINPKLSELFGVKPEDIEGRKYNIFQDDEIIRTGVINHLKRVFENKETARWEVNFDIQHAAESTGVEVSKPEKRWFHNTSYPILNAMGELIYVIIQHEDITIRKLAEEEVIELNRKLEKRVEKRTMELTNSQAALLNLLEDLNEKSNQLEQSAEKLKAKNKELETFTYSVSHDLKAPLRGIDGYSRLLEEMYSDKLQGEGLKFIKTIREGTKQMNQLIEDLLAYSRLERSIYRTSSFNIKELIESIVKLLNNEISGTKAIVNINVENCEIDTDFDGLSIVIRNLLENALKFSGKVESPQINILLEEKVNSWFLTFQDNGIGFDMKYHDRIFEIFQRLNLPEQFTGTGIGLAMVNKSVERMNGKIWAESSPGNGANFYLEIPKNKIS